MRQLAMVGLVLTLSTLVGALPAAAAGGTISGVVKFAGTPPAPKKIAATRDKRVCGKNPIFKEDLVVDKGTGGIQWAVVSLQKASGSYPAKEVVLDQRGCVYQPHVVVMAPGTLKVKNSDRILHNVHSYSSANPAINQAQPGFRKVMTVKFNKPERLVVRCDVHPWMEGWIVVAAHPFYAVTDAKGNFTLENVPPGTHTLEIWQEKLGTVTKQVTVKAGEAAKVTVKMK